MRKVIYALCGIVSFGCVHFSKRSPNQADIKGMVVTCQALAGQAGIEILRNGGNAADAYIATTMAEYVTAAGYTSLSGPLYLLYYDQSSKKTEYLNAGLNTVSDPSGQWSEATKIPGTAYVIGGAARGLESLHQRYGSKNLNFEDVIAAEGIRN
jgi:gamma-glutamyltranspeptidase